MCATIVQAGRGALLYRLSNQLNNWAPLLQRFLKSEDEQARTFAEAHYSIILSCFSDTNCISIANFGLAHIMSATMVLGHTFVVTILNRC